MNICKILWQFLQNANRSLKNQSPKVIACQSQGFHLNNCVAHELICLHVFPAFSNSQTIRKRNQPNIIEYWQNIPTWWMENDYDMFEAKQPQNQIEEQQTIWRVKEWRIRDHPMSSQAAEKGLDVDEWQQTLTHIHKKPDSTARQESQSIHHGICTTCTGSATSNLPFNYYK